jgi:3-oxoacyl-[acyl-carrier protein] reductase
MDLNLKDKLFVVTGATSGFGKSIATALINEGAKVVINARGLEKLQDMQAAFPNQVEILAGDITTDATITGLIRKIGMRKLDGILINAGGPPAKSFVETAISDWDDAYQNVLRWKVKLTNYLLPKLIYQNYGRLLYIESVSVKQPVENLVLSNSLRLAVIGFVKTLSQEIGDQGITLNVIAPGYHATPAMDRLFTKRSELLGISTEEARLAFESEIKSGKLGDPDDLASLGVWLLSPTSRYITGQTFVVDGGLYKGTL